MISGLSNISSPSSSLVSGQSLFIPLTFSCNIMNPTFGVISYANISYKIMENDMYYLVSTYKFQNLTSNQSVEVMNPSLVPTNLDNRVNVIFPVFCRCPNRTQLQNKENYMISYVYQPSDNYSSVASRFNSIVQSIIDVNGDNLWPFETMFIPVNWLSVLSQPAVVASPPLAIFVPAESPNRTGTIRGLVIGLGITGLLLILILGSVVCVIWIDLEKEDVLSRSILPLSTIVHLSGTKVVKPHASEKPIEGAIGYLDRSPPHLSSEPFCPLSFTIVSDAFL